MMDNKENKNQIEETQDIDAEYEEGSKSPFLLIYALIVFLAVLVGVGLWIVKSISADRPVDNTQISASTVTSTSTSDTNSPASTIGGEDAPVIEANDKPLVGKEEKIQQLTKMDKERLTSEQYEGVFLKMHNLSAIDDKLFEKFRGLHIVCTEGMVYNAEDILTALDMIFGNSRTMPQMYMEIDPYDFWISAGTNDNEKEASLGRILRYVETHPETTFEIMYSFPNIEYWNSLSDEQLSSCQEIYYHVTNRFLSYDNVIVYGPGNSDWLTVNRNNYTSLYVPNADVLTKVFINCFCDRDYQLELEDVLKWFSDVKYISDSDKLGMYKHELPQGSKIVLLGDNTICGYTTAGVAGTLAYMTGAKVYNLGFKGISASGDDSSAYALSKLTNAIVQRKIPKEYKDAEIETSLRNFLDECPTSDKVTFIVFAGMNDYLFGSVSYNAQDKASINTTYGGLVNTVKKLKKTYPGSEVILAAPYTMDVNEESTSIYSGKASEPMNAYVSAINKAAKKTAVDCIDLSSEANIGASNADMMLLDDCIHLSSFGEFEIGKTLSKNLLTRKKLK